MCSTKAVWDAWWYGDASKSIGPFRLFDQLDMRTQANKVNLSRATQVMQTSSPGVRCESEERYYLAEGEHGQWATDKGRERQRL